MISSDSVRYYSCVLSRRRKQPRPHCRNSNPGGLFDGDGDEHQRWHRRRRRSCSGGGGSSSPRIWTSAWFDGGGRIAGTSRDRESTQPTTRAICWIGSIPSLPCFFLMLIAFIFTITMTHPVTVCDARVIEPGHFERLAIDRQLVVECLRHYNSLHPVRCGIFPCRATPTAHQSIWSCAWLH